jgi:lipopolysaccharide biosynthesis glycosyltransferase
MSMSAPPEGPIVVCMGFDRNYAKHAGVTIASVVTETRSSPVEFVIVHEGVTPELQRRVEACGRGAKFTWFEISDSRLLSLSGAGHISRATFFRFALTEVLPQSCARAIYLDCDLVTLRDLGALWRYDLKGAPVAAVADPAVDPDAFAALWGLPRNDCGYFNAGVLVLDIERIRTEGIFDRAVSLFETDWDKIKWVDQCALNVVLWGRWVRLDVVWNMQTLMYRPFEAPKLFVELETHRRPAIMHYSGHRKPWQRQNYHPHSGLYYNYLWRTPFEHEVLSGGGVSRERAAFWRLRSAWRLLRASA